MFSYLRYFFGASLVIILVAAVALGLYYRVVADSTILNQAEQYNLSVAKNFTSNIWNVIDQNTEPTGETIKRFATIRPEEWPQYKEFSELLDFGFKTRAIIKDAPIVQFNIYTPENLRLFSTDRAKSLETPKDPNNAITGYNENKNTTLNALVSTTAKSEILYNVSFVNFKGVRVTGILVRTLIPINPVANEADHTVKSSGAIEIFSDVTEPATKLRNFQYYSSALIIIVFVLLYLSLFYTSRRAEKIIEKQHETNVELAAAKADAETENQQKSQFLASISHELRTPLNAIIGFSEIIKDEVMGELANEQYKSYVRDIHSSGVHLLSLINDILDYSKAEAGKLELEYEDIDLTKLIASSLRLQEPRARTAEVILEKDVTNDHIVIRSDAKRLKQVLLNLLSNAVKFTPPGGTVKITAWHNLQDNKTVTIEVKDTGIGIAPKDIAKALAPFGQVDSELSRRYEGTGLGLPLTKKFVELLGGVLKLTSEVGKGTTITIVIPVNNDKNALTPKSFTV